MIPGIHLQRLQLSEYISTSLNQIINEILSAPVDAAASPDGADQDPQAAPDGANQDPQAAPGDPTPTTADPAK